MNVDRIEGNWKLFKGNLTQQWGELTDDQLDLIADKRERLADKLHEPYGSFGTAIDGQRHTNHR